MDKILRHKVKEISPKTELKLTQSSFEFNTENIESFMAPISSLDNVSVLEI